MRKNFERERLKVLLPVFLAFLSVSVSAQSYSELGNVVLRLVCILLYAFPALMVLLIAAGGIFIIAGDEPKRDFGKRLVAGAIISFLILLFIAWLVTLTSPELSFSDYAFCFSENDTLSYPTTSTIAGKQAPWADARVGVVPSPVPEQNVLYSGPGAEVYFDGSRSKDFDGEIVEYEWDFGDDSEKANGVSTSKVYNGNGTYTIFMTATDNDGLSDTDKVQVIIRPLEAYILGPRDKRGFVNSDSVEIAFEGEGKYGAPFMPPDEPYEYEWVSDIKGLFSSEKSFSMKATELGLGSHTIDFTVKDRVGNEESAQITIHVVEALSANILSPESDSMTMGCPVNFTGNASGGLSPYSVEWIADNKVIGKGTIKDNGGTHVFNFMPPAVLQPGTVYDIVFRVEDSSDLEAEDNVSDIEVVMCDECLTASPQGPGVAVSGAYSWGIQKYTSSSQLVKVGSSSVASATATALAEGINNHPEWGLSDPNGMTTEQRFQAIYEWITGNMGYLCDQPGGACPYNCPECSGHTLCKCLTPDGWTCPMPDVWASGEDTISLSQKCCSSGPYEYHGDCDDYAHLFISMSRTADISEECVGWKLGPGHAFNAGKVDNRWEYIDTQAGNYYGWSWTSMINRGGYSCGGYGAHQGYTDYAYHDKCGG